MLKCVSSPYCYLKKLLLKKYSKPNDTPPSFRTFLYHYPSSLQLLRRIPIRLSALPGDAGADRPIDQLSAGSLNSPEISHFH